VKVVATQNVVRNLEALERFRPERPQAWLKLNALLPTRVIPLLRKQPGVGRLFDRGQLTPSPLLEHIGGRLGGGELREYLVGEYLLLYLVGPKQQWLVAIRHSRELAYSFIP
jgi:hypothetical protein